MKRIAILASVAPACMLACGLVLTACKPAPVADAAPQADVVALLDGQPIERAWLEELERQQAGAASPAGAASAAAAASAASAPALERQRLLDELVGIELLARKARERGLHAQPAIQAEGELQAKTLLAQAMVREQVAALEVSDADLTAAYDEQVPPHQFKVAHVLLADAGKAQAVMAQLQQGRPFAELARRHSVDTATRSQGGSLGWLVFDQMPTELAMAVRHLKPGETAAQPVQTAQGWHVLQLQALQPRADRPTLQAARAWLHPQIVRAKVQAQQQQWRREARIVSSAAATATEPPLPEGAVAVVNGQPIARALLDELVRTREANAPPNEKVDRQQVLDDLVHTELLGQRARSTGLASRRDTRAELEVAHKTLLGQRLLQQLSNEMKIDDAEVQARYQALQMDVEIDTRHILVKDEATARDLIAQLKGGASFAKLASQHTLDTETRVRGGAIGALSTSQLTPAYVNAARALKPGEYTPVPVQTEFGWHVIRLESVQTQPKPAFEKVKGELRQQIATERLQVQLTQWRKEAKLSVVKAP